MDKKSSKSFKEYDAKIKNLEGILTNISQIIDVSSYQIILEKIKSDLHNDQRFAFSMSNSNMQFDYEMHQLSPYLKRIDDLTQIVEDEVKSFYEIHLMSLKIQNDLNSVNEKTILEIIADTKKMISLMNSSVTHNKKDLQNVIARAYQTIYNVILYEEIFNHSDILFFIIGSNNSTHIENIGRLLFKDLSRIDNSQIVDNALKGIKKEGLGYDFLSLEIVREVASKVLKRKNKMIEERKKDEERQISRKVSSLLEGEHYIKIVEYDKKNSFRNLQVNILAFTSRVAAFVLVPIIGFTSGKAIGTNASNNITEYNTITRTINPETKEIVGEIESMYDEKETTYVATVQECSPWRKNPLGNGYIRDVITYEYHAQNSDEIDLSNLTANSVIKYRYLESKEELDSKDSMDEKTILVTETYQDKNDSRKSTKYIIPGIIIGAVSGIALDIAMYFLGRFRLKGLEELFDDIKCDAEKYHLCKDEIKMRIANLKSEANDAQRNYNEVIEIYGDFDNQEYIETIKRIILDSKGKAKRKIIQ